MNTKLNKIYAEISAAELIDKITILEIKHTKIKDKSKLNEINKELLSLRDIYKKSIENDEIIKDLSRKLKDINLKLWDIEDSKRFAEKNKKFDENFISLSRNVYKFNDERAKIKMKINEILGSNIKEVKSYY